MSRDESTPSLAAIVEDNRYRDLLEPDADRLELVPVSTAVNSVKNDGPECAERLP
jgi:putative SOS response-associated peptidase YedK